MALCTLNKTDLGDQNPPRGGQELFRNVVAAIQEYAIVLVSPDGFILTWNAGAQCVNGYTERDILGQHIERFYTPQDRAAGRPRMLLATARARGRVEDEGWRVRKDGTRYWADVVITAHWDEQRRLIGFASVTRDLTSRRQEAQAILLRAGEELHSSLDYETTLQRVVRHAVPILADACWVDLVVDDSRVRPMAVAHVDPAKRAWLRERVRATAEEERVPVSPDAFTALRELVPTSGVSIPLTARGRILGVLSLARIDGSPPFAPQELPLIQQLARQCALALDNARLYREAQEAVRLRDEFLAATSHELRRPLSEIKGFATTLLRTDVRWDEPTGQDFLQEIDRQADRLDALIKDLLDLSLLASGARMHFERTPTPPEVVVKSALDRVRGHVSSGALDIQPELAALPAVWVDAARIEQVVVNLIENAAKYAPGSPIHVSGGVVNGGREVEFWVEDEGPGIPADDLEHIFDKFYRGERAERSEIPGTGLGLAIAKAIMERHGGNIRAENRPGGGARFVLTLLTG